MLSHAIQLSPIFTLMTSLDAASAHRTTTRPTTRQLDPPHVSSAHYPQARPRGVAWTHPSLPCTLAWLSGPIPAHPHPCASLSPSLLTQPLAPCPTTCTEATHWSQSHVTHLQRGPFSHCHLLGSPPMRSVLPLRLSCPMAAWRPLLLPCNTLPCPRAPSLLMAQPQPFLADDPLSWPMTASPAQRRPSILFSNTLPCPTAQLPSIGPLPRGNLPWPSPPPTTPPLPPACPAPLSLIRPTSNVGHLPNCLQ